MSRHLTTPEPRAHLGRRSLVRTGVTAAWAVPAITVAAAAPAFAACSGQADLSGSTPGQPSRSGKIVTITVTLNNSGATTSGLALSVSGPDPLHTLDQVSASGWSTESGGNGGSQTLTSVAGAQVTCETLTAVTFKVSMHSNAAHQQLGFMFSTAGGVGYTFAVTV